MIRVQMLTDFRSAAGDGVQVVNYAAESFHDVPADVAAVWEKKGVARLAEGEALPGEPVPDKLIAEMTIPELKKFVATNELDDVDLELRRDELREAVAKAHEAKILAAPENTALLGAPETK